MVKWRTPEDGDKPAQFKGNLVSRMKHLFGPVASRRLGRSLGVDLVRHKICSLDCIYCECGPTTELTALRKEYVPTKDILFELDQYLPDLEDRLDFVTFSGSGEPTLSTAIGTVTRHIHSLVSTPVALLTNATLLYREDVIEDISEIDVIIPSLDTADPATFRSLNRPVSTIDFLKYLQGLRQLKSRIRGKIWLEILLCRGINDTPRELDKLAEEIKRIEPDAIQLNTPIRPGTDPEVLPLTSEELEIASAHMGITSQQLARLNYENVRQEISANSRDAILEIVRRRPCTVDDLAAGMGWPVGKVHHLVSDLHKSGALTFRMRNGNRYYSANV